MTSNIQAPLAYSTMWASVPSLRTIHHIHMIGIGGSGMSGIAEVLWNMGYQVTGSDHQSNQMSQRLVAMGIQVATYHCATHIAGADIVVYSSAIPTDNPEWQAAQAAGIPLVSRAEMLAELMRFKLGIAVAGTHGKTTTTSLIASILAEADLDPTFVIGGRLNRMGAHAKLGSGAYFIAEADESDGSFLLLPPLISVVTNIDQEHLGHYNDSFTNLRQAFAKYIKRLPFYGLAVVCGDDPNLRALLPDIVNRRIITYGFNQHVDVQITKFHQQEHITHFSVQAKEWPQSYQITLNLPGKHNALNATAALIVALELGLSISNIKTALKSFAGIDRRFQVFGPFQRQQKSFLLIDDYGHHPAEVTAVLKAIVSGWPQRRICMVYQPHRYSRTQALFDLFLQVFLQIDRLILLDVYAAGEDSIPGAETADLCQALRQRGKEVDHVTDATTLPDILEADLREGDIIVMQGAGNIGHHTHMLRQRWQSRAISALPVAID